MTEPRRIQLRRTAGYRKPRGAIVVRRPSRWGNPFDWQELGRHEAIERYRLWLAGAFAETIPFRKTVYRRPSAAEIAELRGKDLACTCGLNEPCHGDVLLQEANP
jgi:hypothetical protein